MGNLRNGIQILTRSSCGLSNRPAEAELEAQEIQKGLQLSSSFVQKKHLRDWNPETVLRQSLKLTRTVMSMSVGIPGRSRS